VGHEWSTARSACGQDARVEILRTGEPRPRRSGLCRDAYPALACDAPLALHAAARDGAAPGRKEGFLTSRTAFGTDRPCDRQCKSTGLKTRHYKGRRREAGLPGRPPLQESRKHNRRVRNGRSQRRTRGSERRRSLPDSEGATRVLVAKR
jgi:hypothetical protein